MDNTFTNFSNNSSFTPTSNYPNQPNNYSSQQNKYNSQNQFTHLNPLNNHYQFHSIQSLFTNYPHFQNLLNSNQIQIHFTLTNLQTNTFIQIPNLPTTNFPNYIITNSNQLPHIYNFITTKQNNTTISNQLQLNNKIYSLSYLIFQPSTSQFFSNFHQISNKTQNIQSIPNNIPQNYQYPLSNPQQTTNNIFNQPQPQTPQTNPTPQPNNTQQNTTPQIPLPNNPQI